MSTETSPMQDEHSRSGQSGPRTRPALIAIVLLIVGIVYVTSRPVPPPGWSEDFQEATRRAAEQGRDVLVAFHSSACPPCRAMDRDVLSRKRVQDRLRSLVPVRIDPARQADLARSFGVYATPTYAVLSPEGKIQRVTGGYQDVDEFIRFLDGVRIRKMSSLSVEVVDPPADP